PLSSPTMCVPSVPPKLMPLLHWTAERERSSSAGGPSHQYILLPRMELVVYRVQSCFQHVRIDLGRRQVGVPEHDLNGSKVGAPLEQVRRERVSQNMRAQRPRHASFDPV